MRRHRRKVKIIATLGPSSSSVEMIGQLHEAGADVFRINMSHTSHDLLRELYGAVRQVEAKAERPIAVLADLQGPKLRVGDFAAGAIELGAGERFRLDLEPTLGDGDRVQLPHPEVFKVLEPGQTLLLDDGKIRLRVDEASPDSALTTVLVGGRLSNHKGVNLPDTVLPIRALTPKDLSDLEQAVNIGVDWIALSFVQRPEDLMEARKMIGGRAALLAKIEKPAALQRLDEILEQSDALMVARGDLGVELPLESVPGRQKQITRAARRAGKPVVVATQMLESMINAPVPTRAEVSDVATAVYEGADAIMLSAESAAGKFPVEAVSMMNRIAEKVETDPLYAGIIDAQRSPPEPTTADALMAAAKQIVSTVRAAAIVCWTASGSTALRAARERPEVPIIALTPVLATARRLGLCWGLHCVLTEDAHDLDDMVERAARITFQEGVGQPGQRIVITAGVPLRTPGATNMLRVAYIGSPRDPDLG
jgi:pyruvate kinase